VFLYADSSSTAAVRTNLPAPEVVPAHKGAFRAS